MLKKILLTIFFCSVLLFIPLVKVGATQVYVGVQINAAQAPGYPAGSVDNNWCLPVESEMVILNTTACSYLTSNYPATYMPSYCPTSVVTAIAPTSTVVELTTPVCNGSTFWSGLLNLTNGGSYKIYIYTPNFCSGYSDGNCYQKWIAGKNCNEICSHYGMTPYTSGTNCLNYYGTYEGGTYTCSMLANLKGSACASCTDGTHSYYSTSTNACWRNSAQWSACTWSDPNYVRVCACNFDYTATGFNFNFTASF